MTTIAGCPVVLSVSAETPVMIQPPTRCSAYWQLDTKLMDLLKDRPKGERIDDLDDSDPVIEVWLKLTLHIKSCPQCKQWWAEMTHAARMAVLPKMEDE
jgi:hypothetical protein